MYTNVSYNNTFLEMKYIFGIFVMIIVNVSTLQSIQSMLDVALYMNNKTTYCFYFIYPSIVIILFGFFNQVMHNLSQ